MERTDPGEWISCYGGMAHLHSYTHEGTYYFACGFSYLARVAGKRTETARCKRCQRSQAAAMRRDSGEI